MRANRPWPIAVAVLRASVRHRLNGHAAEISFFALLALIPATVTVGTSLQVLAHIFGQQVLDRGRQGATDTIRVLIGPKLSDSVVTPFVRAQMTAQHGGVAIGGLILTWWLASHLFTATSNALDAAYRVSARRPNVVQRLIALAYVVVTVAAVTVALAVLAVGLQGNEAGINRLLHRVPALNVVWEVLRWPLLFVIMVAVLVGLYRYSPNVRHRWRQCLPGAVVGVVLWIGAAIAFRAYLALGAGAPTGVAAADPEVNLIGRAVGASIGTGVWIYFSSLAVLLGAEVNAELLRIKEVRPAQTSAVEPAGWARRLQERVPLLHHIAELADEEDTAAPSASPADGPAADEGQSMPSGAAVPGDDRDGVPAADPDTTGAPDDAGMATRDSAAAEAGAADKRVVGPAAADDTPATNEAATDTAADTGAAGAAADGRIRRAAAQSSTLQDSTVAPNGSEPTALRQEPLADQNGVERTEQSLGDEAGLRREPLHGRDEVG
jgi:membrane protein